LLYNTLNKSKKYNAKHKALFFVNSYSGGAELMTLNIAGFLDPERYEVIFYVIGKDLGRIANFIPADKPSHHIKVKSYKDFLTIKLFTVMLREKPKFVFSSLMPINIRMCFASILLPRIKVIVRANNYLHTQSILQKLRLFLAYKFANKLIVQTDEMNTEHVNILRLNRDKIITLANPVNIEKIEKKLTEVTSPFKTSYVNYVFVGRISKVKGLDILISAFQQVIAEQPKSILHIIGDIEGIFTPYHLELIELASSLGIQSSNLIFHGFSMNPYMYMKYADSFILPSRNEGLPNVIVESLYLGTPVVATNSVPVINRLVNNKIDGYVVDVDDIDALAKAMILAVKLGRVETSYKPATKNDFQRVFV
jgi:glycosyltransferase involved in cell wall biosynthesis